MTQGSRVAIVTGAARGIGAATARRLAEDGLAVAVLDLDEGAARGTAEAIGTAGGRAIAVTADVSDAQAVEAAVSRVVAELGAPTVLVNNAGVTRDNLLFRMSDPDWDTVMDVHLRGAFLMSRATQQHMTEAGWGRIVNLSSTSALGNRGQANYSAAKAGLQGFTKTLAIELGRFGVTVNAVAPGFVRTEMTEATAERVGVPYDDFIELATKDIPVGRVGQPEDIAHLVSFFVNEGAGFVSSGRSSTPPAAPRPEGGLPDAPHVEPAVGPAGSPLHDLPHEGESSVVPGRCTGRASNASHARPPR